MTAISEQALKLAAHRPLGWKARRSRTIGRLSAIEFDLLDALLCIGQHATADMVAARTRGRLAKIEGRLQRARACGLLKVVEYGVTNNRPAKAYVPSDMGAYLFQEALRALDERAANDHRLVIA